jgi:hypothetical protein
MNSIALFVGCASNRINTHNSQRTGVTFYTAAQLYRVNFVAFFRRSRCSASSIN